MSTRTCQACKQKFSCIQLVDGKKVKLYGRINCLRCAPIGKRTSFYKCVKYTKEQFIEAVRTSCSIHEVLVKLNLNASGGGNYQSFKKAIKTWNVDASHFTSKAWSKGKKVGSKRDIQEYLDNKFPIQSYALKLRLLKEGFKYHQCEKCLLTTWNDLPIPIELDHINGNNQDNRLENLRILCPNCHAQTSTHAGKNKKIND